MVQVRKKLKLEIPVFTWVCKLFLCYNCQREGSSDKLPFFAPFTIILYHLKSKSSIQFDLLYELEFIII